MCTFEIFGKRLSSELFTRVGRELDARIRLSENPVRVPNDGFILQPQAVIDQLYRCIGRRTTLPKSPHGISRSVHATAGRS